MNITGNTVVANVLNTQNKTASNAVITIRPSPSADTRSATHLISEEELRKSTEMHISDVKQGMQYLAELIKDRGDRHDWTKLQYFASFYKQFTQAQKTGCWGNGWYDKTHCVYERHHIEDGCPEDVNLIDILEHIVDCVMAGKARAGEFKLDILGAGILEQAYANTQKMLADAVRVKAEI